MSKNAQPEAGETERTAAEILDRRPYLEMTPQLLRVISEMGGGAGPARWVVRMDALLYELENLWGFEVVGSLGGRDDELVLAGSADGEELVLTLPARQADGMATAAAYRVWGSTDLVPRVIDVDVATGTIMARRVAGIEGYTPVPSEVVAETLGVLHEVGWGWTRSRRKAGGPRTQEFAALGAILAAQSEWAESRGETTERTAAAWADGVELARTYAGPRVLLHGDFCVQNLIFQPGRQIADGRVDLRRLVAVRPRPVVGDPNFDAGRYVASAPNADEAFEALVGRLGLSPERVSKWAQILADLDGRGEERGLRAAA